MGEAIFQAAHCGTPGGARATAGTFLSELDCLSIDIHGWSPPQDPIVIEVHQPFDNHQPAGLELPQGNFVQVLAMSEAHGANTLSATLTNALTVENHFSFVTALAMVAR
jgi:hypothetical protein